MQQRTTTTWTLKRLLATGFWLVMAWLVAVAALGIYGQWRGERALATLYLDRTVALERLGTLRHLIAHHRILLADAVLQASDELSDQRLAQHEADRSRLARDWAAHVATDPTPEGRRRVEELQLAMQRLDTEAVLPLVAALKARRYDEARTLLDRRLGPLYPSVVDALDALIARQASEARAEFEASQAVAQRLAWATGLLALAALVLGGAAARWTSRRLLARLGAEPAALAAVADRIAAGDLSGPGAGDAPRGSVMASLQAMRAALAGILGEVRSGSDDIATASGRIAQGHRDLSSRTERQAGALQQTAASMEQLGSAVRQTADNARRADQLAQGASSVAQQGGAVVSAVVQTMRDIHASSRRIADIIAVIDGIAFRTNILALNAAVESARAGEQGRGFAIVAGEVRTLAQRSASAAREIKDLITDSVQRVEAGTALADRAGSTMQEVVDSIRRVTDVVAEISAATTAQSTGVAQVGQAVVQMDRGTQHDAALVEQSAAAAARLRHQACQLVEAVAAFRLVATA